MGGDIKGGGLTYYKTDLLSNSALMYGEGLRVPNTSGHAQLDSLNSTVIYGKRKYFERVINPNVGYYYPFQIERNSTHDMACIIWWFQKKCH
jgi:hypothetical protein